MLKHAISRMTDVCLQEAKDALQEFDNVVSSGTDINTWASLNWDFHSCLYRPANKPITLNLCGTLHANTDRYQRQQLLLSGAAPRANKEHMEILSLCETSSVDQAVSFLQQHILGVADQVKCFIQNYLK